jgi:phosphoadenosine phosphosulfate reductase
MGTPAFSPQAVSRLNEGFESAHPVEIIRWATAAFRPDIAMTSSFGAESAALIHMAIQIDPHFSIRMVDTGFLFPETLQFADELKKRFNLNLSVFRTKMDVEKFKRDNAHLSPEDPAYCCGDYKVEATQRALNGLKAWVTGIRRSQAKTRAQTPFVEVAARVHDGAKAALPPAVA